MFHRTRTPLSQGRIDAMIQFGTERTGVRGAAARREIARLRRDLGLPDPAGSVDGTWYPDEMLGARR